MGGGGEAAAPRIERVRASIKAATFTANYDKEKVVGLYDEYIAKIGNAMNASGEVGGKVYEGEYNAAGEREGYGTLQSAAGDVYEGQWKGGKGGAARSDDGACTRESSRRVRERARHSIVLPTACTRESSRRVSMRGAARFVGPTVT